jgi:hypothetical protein
VAALQRDLELSGQQSTHIAILSSAEAAIEFSESAEDHVFRVVRDGVERGLIAFPADQTDAETTRSIADWIQDDILFDTGALWPRCPEHEHPLAPKLSPQGGVQWECPARGFVARLGQLSRL